LLYRLASAKHLAIFSCKILESSLLQHLFPIILVLFSQLQVILVSSSLLLQAISSFKLILIFS